MKSYELTDEQREKLATYTFTQNRQRLTCKENIVIPTEREAQKKLLKYIDKALAPKFNQDWEKVTIDKNWWMMPRYIWQSLLKDFGL